MRRHDAGRQIKPRCAAYRTQTSWAVYDRGEAKCGCGRWLKLRLHPVREGDYPEVTFPAHISGADQKR